jgi:hypothetical protein
MGRSPGTMPPAAPGFSRPRGCRPLLRLEPRRAREPCDLRRARARDPAVPPRQAWLLRHRIFIRLLQARLRLRRPWLGGSDGRPGDELRERPLPRGLLPRRRHEGPRRRDHPRASRPRAARPLEPEAVRRRGSPSQLLQGDGVSRRRSTRDDSLRRLAPARPSPISDTSPGKQGRRCPRCATAPTIQPLPAGLSTGSGRRRLRPPHGSRLPAGQVRTRLPQGGDQAELRGQAPRLPCR